ncbi:MAG: hypothetical protein EXQ89_03505 [Rhodospirillaceae bacterium]|nr:hypothetical protein [Rhodospirillaceae bacterium]
MPVQVVTTQSLFETEPTTPTPTTPTPTTPTPTTPTPTTPTIVFNATFSSPFADSLVGSEGPDSIAGGAGNDVLSGRGGNDTLVGDGDDDTLLGEFGDDTLIGLGGIDGLFGGVGDDLYLIGQGSQFDFISDSASNAGDELNFSRGLSPIDLDIHLDSGTNLSLGVDDEHIESIADIYGITIENFFTDGGGRGTGSIERLSFASITLSTVGATPTVINQSESNNTLATADDIARSAFGIGPNADVGDAALPWVSINGIIGPGDGAQNDVDFYALHLRAGETVYLDIDYGFNSGTQVDTILGFWDSAGTRLAQNDDDFTIPGGGGSVHGFDSYIQHTVTADGTYYASVTAYANFGSNGPSFNNAANSAYNNGDYVLNISLNAVPGITIPGYALTFALAGTAGSDLLVGSDNPSFGPETINGGDGDDAIFGNAGAENLIGGTGNDHLSGGDGTDTLFGGDGNDTLFGGGGADVLDGGTGNDVLVASQSVELEDTLMGGAGDDTYAYSVGGATISDSGGTDTVTLTSGVRFRDVNRTGNNLILTTETGNIVVANHFTTAQVEQIVFAGDNRSFLAATTTAGTSAGDLIVGTAGVDTIVGGDGGDFIAGLAGADSLMGNTGDDLLIGGAGNDVLDGGAGNDAAIFGDLTVNVTVNLVSGTAITTTETDTLISIESVRGGSGNDLITGDTFDNELAGGAGNDTLLGGAGNDTYRFGAVDGLDTINDSVGDDTIMLTTGLPDVFRPTFVDAFFDLGNLVLRVDANNRLTVVGNSVEQIRFEDFPNLVFTVGSTPAAGNDFVVAGTSEVSLEANTINGLGGADILFGNGGNDHLSGGLDNDHLSGGLDNDNLFGGAGNDNLDGGGGSDSLYGNEGDDFLEGGAGADSLEGGLGDDVYIYDGTEVGGFGTDTLRDEGGFDALLCGNLLAANLTLGRSGDNLILDFGAAGQVIALDHYGANRIEGIGFDPISGRLDTYILSATNTGTAGGDAIAGTAANDTLIGRDGDDLLFGNSGADTIVGGRGGDDMRGGDGNDVFFYNATNEGTVVAANGVFGFDVFIDVLRDFATGVDTFNFVSSAFGNLATGTLAPGNFTTIIGDYDGTNASTQFIFDDLANVLYYDGNGSAAGYTVIAQTGSSNVTNTNIQIVAAGIS